LNSGRTGKAVKKDPVPASSQEHERKKGSDGLQRRFNLSELAVDDGKGGHTGLTHESKCRSL